MSKNVMPSSTRPAQHRHRGVVVLGRPPHALAGELHGAVAEADDGQVAADVEGARGGGAMLVMAPSYHLAQGGESASRVGGYPMDMDLPTPRGPLTETLFSALRSGDDFFAVLTAAAGRRPRRRRARALGAAPAALPRPHRRARRPGVGPPAAPAARPARARPRAAAALPVHAADGAELRRRLLRLGRRARRRLDRRARAPRRDPGAGAGADPDALDLPPHGVRPDRVGRAAARRARQGRR